MERRIELSLSELREVTAYAVECSRPALVIFERDRPSDRRPRTAIETASGFAAGGKRSKALRDCAWCAQRAASEARALGLSAASEAARATLAAAGAAFLHPIAASSQIKHILGAAAHAARALEIAAGGDPAVGSDYVRRSRNLASPIVVDVLRRYPLPPPGGGRAGGLLRQLDDLLR